MLPLSKQFTRQGIAVSEGFKRPPVSPGTTGNAAPIVRELRLLFDKVAIHSSWHCRNQRFTISLAQSNHQRMVGARTASESKRPVNQRGVVAGAEKQR